MLDTVARERDASWATGIRRFEAADVELVVGWLAAEDNHRWLDFGQGVQALSAVSLKLMMQRALHSLFIFTAEGGVPAGIVGISNVDRKFGTATLWYVLGEKRFGGQGHTTRAVRSVLEIAFTELGLRSINAWAVDGNAASLRVLEKTGFRPVGRLRRCHTVDGKSCDRIIFDILATEAKGTPAPAAPEAAPAPSPRRKPRAEA